jgi:hypothetical protein
MAGSIVPVMYWAVRITLCGLPSTCFTTAPSMRKGECSVHNHLLCLDHVEGEVVVLAPHGQVSDLLLIGCLIVVGGQVVLAI